MELEQLPSELLVNVLRWAGSKNRAILCSVSKKLSILSLRMLPRLDANIKYDMQDIILSGNYHLFVHIFNRKCLSGQQQLIGTAAACGCVDLLELFIAEKIPLTECDWIPIGIGGSCKCIKLVTDYAAETNTWVNYCWIASGAARCGRVELVRDLLPDICKIDYQVVMGDAVRSKDRGLEIVNMLIGAHKEIGTYALSNTAISAIEYNNMDCLRAMIARGVKPALEITGMYGNIEAFKLLVPSPITNTFVVGFTFESACNYGHMKFVCYMLDNYRHVINVTGGFRNLDVKLRVEFMKKCLELGIEFDADAWFEHTYCLSGGPGDVCEWMARCPAIKLSEHIWLEYGANTEEKWAEYGEQFRDIWKRTEKALRERREGTCNGE